VPELLQQLKHLNSFGKIAPGCGTHGCIVRIGHAECIVTRKQQQNSLRAGIAFPIPVLQGVFAVGPNAISVHWGQVPNVGSYSLRITSATVSLPTAAGWTKQDDRGVWQQNGFTVTVMGHVNVTTRDKSPLPAQAAAAMTETFSMGTHGNQEETPVAAHDHGRSPRDRHAA